MREHLSPSGPAFVNLCFFWPFVFRACRMPHRMNPRGQVSDILTEEIEELNLARTARTTTYVDTFTYP